jgi:formylglycine-generating enzyme required for sulfatase activity
MNHPVEQVAWYDAAQFCNDLSLAERLPPAYARNSEGAGESPGIGYRLPTEAEWEYACRAGTTTRFWSGETDEQLLRVAWAAPNSDGQTHAVGQRPANFFGLYDMHGNVWEWCHDSARKYTAAQAVNPAGQAMLLDSARCIRGGGCLGNEFCLYRSARRGGQKPDYADRGVGFRVVLSVEAARQLLARRPADN